MSDETYVIITGKGAPGKNVHCWDGRSFTDRAAADEHGFEAFGEKGGCHPAFNVGVVRDGELVSWWWMDDQIPSPPEKLARIGRECGLERLLDC